MVSLLKCNQGERIFLLFVFYFLFEINSTSSVRIIISSVSRYKSVFFESESNVGEE